MKIKCMFFSVFFLAGSLAFSAQKIESLSLQAEGVDRLEINCGAGFLKVRGVESLGSIEVKGEINIQGIDGKKSEEFIKGNIEFTLERKGSRAVLISRVKDRPLFSLRDTWIDLTVDVPLGINLDIEDGSGSIDIEKIRGSLTVEDGSGEIQVRDIQGDLEIDDGSGEIDIRNVRGDVRIDDGSGSIEISGIEGNVTVRDGSGSIDIERVEKDLILKGTGSGGLHFRNIRGRVIK